MARSMSLMIEGWMPSVGSSRISRRGPKASARPIASCCCWPPERSPPRRLSICFKTGNISKMRSGIGVPPGRVASPICRFSSTVRRGKISRPCGT
jgi:hypothetical protein